MLILFFILPHIFAETCDMLYAPKKIQHLSTEISCANSSSLKDCQRMVFHKEINKDNKVSEAESCCGNEKKMSLVSPMTVAARKTLDQLKDNFALEGMLVIKRGQRLSVQPVEKQHFDEVCRMANIHL